MHFSNRPSRHNQTRKVRRAHRVERSIKEEAQSCRWPRVYISQQVISRNWRVAAAVIRKCRLSHPTGTALECRIYSSLQKKTRVEPTNGDEIHRDGLKRTSALRQTPNWVWSYALVSWIIYAGLVSRSVTDLFQNCIGYCIGR